MFTTLMWGEEGNIVGIQTRANRVGDCFLIFCWLVISNLCVLYLNIFWWCSCSMELSRKTNVLHSDYYKKLFILKLKGAHNTQVWNVTELNRVRFGSSDKMNDHKTYPNKLLTICDFSYCSSWLFAYYQINYPLNTWSEINCDK